MTQAADCPARRAPRLGPLPLGADTPGRGSAWRRTVTAKSWARPVGKTNQVKYPSMATRLNLAGTRPARKGESVNIPKTAAGTSAGVVDLSAVIRLLSPATIVLKCADFNTQVETHNAVLTAIGG